jgi:hypothetical protein
MLRLLLFLFLFLLLPSVAFAQAPQGDNALGAATTWSDTDKILMCQAVGGCDVSGTKPLVNGIPPQAAAYVGVKLFPTNNTTLKALDTSTLVSGVSVAYRQGTTTPGDGGAALYTWSSSACTLASGAGDDKTQVKPSGAGTGCWLIDTSAVAAGATNAIQFNNAGVLGGVAPVNSAVVSTTSGGVPQESTTLPSGLTVPTPTITAGTISGTAITGLPVPSAATDAATKSYVDATAAGLVVHTPVVAATTATLGTTPSYNNGTAGVGATLTNGVNGVLSIDGVSPAASSRVLLKNQGAGGQNGVYTVTNVGSGSTAWILTRATDYDTAAAGEIIAGAYTFVSGGTANGGSSWTLTTTGAITVGTTALTYAQFSGASTVYTADNTTLQLTGSQFSVKTVPNANLATMATGTYKGNISGSTATPSDLTAAQVNSDLAAGGFALQAISGTRYPLWLGARNDCNHALFNNLNQPCGDTAPQASNDVVYIRYLQGLVLEPVTAPSLTTWIGVNGNIHFGNPQQLQIYSGSGKIGGVTQTYPFIRTDGSNLVLNAGSAGALLLNYDQGGTISFGPAGASGYIDTTNNDLHINNHIYASGEVISYLSTEPGQFRMVGGSYGSFWRNDGTDTYLLLTNTNDVTGSFNSLRPFTVHDSTGAVSMGNGLKVLGSTAVASISLGDLGSRGALWLAGANDCNHAMYNNFNQPCSLTSPTGNNDVEYVDYLNGLVFANRNNNTASYFDATGNLHVSGNIFANNLSGSNFVCDDNFDNTSAINVALAVPNTVVTLPSGTCKVNGSLIQNQNGTMLKGQGWGATTLHCAGAVDCILIGSRTNPAQVTWGDLRDIRLHQTGGAGYCINIYGQTQYTVQNVYYDCNALASVGSSNNISFLNMNGYTHVAGGGAIRIADTIASGGRTDVVTFNNFDLNALFAGADCMQLDGPVYTIRMHGAAFLQCAAGIYMLNSAQSQAAFPLFLFGHDLEIEGCINGCLDIFAGGQVHLSDCFIAPDNQPGSWPIFTASDVPYSYTRGIYITGCEVHNTNVGNAYFNVKDVKVSASSFFGGSRTFPSVEFGPATVGGTLANSFVGFRWGDQNPPAYGMQVDSGAVSVTWIGNDASGGAVNGSLVNNSSLNVSMVGGIANTGNVITTNPYCTPSTTCN